VDIAPTLTALMGVKVPEGAFDGRCLDIDGGPNDTLGRPQQACRWHAAGVARCRSA
jgi:arylsulfatase A-like enzyme